MKFTVYHWDPNEICGVPLESYMKFMLYHWNPNEIHGVPLES